MLERSWVGRRVSVRRVVERGDDGRLLFGDVVGDLLALDEQTAVVDTRRGLVEVPVELVSIARLTPPSTAEELALEDVVARGWRAEHTSSLGGWLLRASGGFTGRANSVLPLRAPGMPVTEALTRARAWYAGHGLPLRIQVPVEARRLLDADLAERGWHPSPLVHVMTARLDRLPGAAGGAVSVTVTAEPDVAWLRRYRDGQGLEPAAEGILRRHDRVAFAAVRSDDGTALAIGRGTVDDHWLGVTAVEVDPAHRRQGLAGAVMAALVAWGADEGATHCHLEVQEDNAPALALYRALGFHTHHDYRYLDDPGADAAPVPSWLDR